MIEHIIYTSGNSDKAISISGSDVQKAEEALTAFRMAADIEEKYSIVLSNYYDFELCLLEHSVKQTASHPYNENFFLKANTRIINLLTSTRLYLDHLSHHISEFHNTLFSGFDFNSIRTAQYDALFGYRFMEALRNYVQHRELPVHGMPSRFINDERGIRYTTDVTIKKARLMKDKKFKVQVLDGVHDSEISLALCAREQMEGLKNIQIAVRKQISPDIGLLFEHLDGLASKLTPKADRFCVESTPKPSGVGSVIRATFHKYEVWKKLSSQNSCMGDLRRISVNSEVPVRDKWSF